VLANVGRVVLRDDEIIRYAVGGHCSGRVGG
jgi:hypothetical protein